MANQEMLRIVYPAGSRAQHDKQGKDFHCGLLMTGSLVVVQRHAAVPTVGGGVPRSASRVTIRTLEQDEEVVVMVADDGIGIDPADLPHIFDVFHRGRRVAAVNGHGLGLATVQGLVEGHGGRVLVSSAANAGATFTVFFPKGECGPSHSVECFSSADREEN
jgi:hypothetical protein